jgi:hypothetical protein
MSTKIEVTFKYRGNSVRLTCEEGETLESVKKDLAEQFFIDRFRVTVDSEPEKGVRSGDVLQAGIIYAVETPGAHLCFWSLFVSFLSKHP